MTRVLTFSRLKALYYVLGTTLICELKTDGPSMLKYGIIQSFQIFGGTRVQALEI